jgi:hypothetical protein
MSDDAPISLTDDQLLAVITCAEVLPLEDRSRFLHRVAALLRDCVIGDGAVNRAARQAQAEVFRAPQFNGNSAPRAGRVAGRIGRQVALRM